MVILQLAHSIGFMSGKGRGVAVKRPREDSLIPLLKWDIIYRERLTQGLWKGFFNVFPSAWKTLLKVLVFASPVSTSTTSSLQFHSGVEVVLLAEEREEVLCFFQRQRLSEYSCWNTADRPWRLQESLSTPWFIRMLCPWCGKVPWGTKSWESWTHFPKDSWSRIDSRPELGSLGSHLTKQLASRLVFMFVLSFCSLLWLDWL